MRSETASCRSKSSGPASTANYHQSRGLIKVWLSSECSWGYAEWGIRRGPTQDHTVSVRGRRCEIGLLAIINLWPPRVPRRLVNSAAGKKKTHSRERRIVLLDVQEKWDAASLERLSLSTSRLSLGTSMRDWMYKGRFFFTEQYEQKIHNPHSPHLSRWQWDFEKVLFVSSPQEEDCAL